MSFGAQKSPDYKGAAEAQGQSSIDAINAQTTANRPNMYTPWGNMQWENNDGQWTGRLNLSPESQAAFDSQQRIQMNQSGLAEDLQGRAADALGKPMDWSGFQQIGGGEATRDRVTGAVYDQMMSRINPEFKQREDASYARLLAEGIDPRGEAAGFENDRLSRGYNDAQQGALRGAITMGGQEAQRDWTMDMGTRQQQITEALQQRSQPLNEMQAVLTGQQVQQPTMPTFSQAGAAQPTPYLGAAQMQGQYNLAGQQQTNQMLASVVGGATQAGSAYLGNPFAF